MFCSLFTIRILAADFERLFIICALAWLTKVQNIWFRLVIEFIFRYVIEANFTAWRVSSTSKTDIVLIASWLVRYRFFTLISTWNSLFRQWIFLYCTTYWKMGEGEIPSRNFSKLSKYHSFLSLSWYFGDLERTLRIFIPYTRWNHATSYTNLTVKTKNNGQY